MRGVLDGGEISQNVVSHCFECHLTIMFGVTFENKLVLAFPGEELHFFLLHYMVLRWRFGDCWP